MSEIGKKIDNIISLGIAPLLKDLKFKKKGRDFYRQFDDRIDVINIQASKWNEGDSGEFTVNLGVYYPDVAKITEDSPVQGIPKEYQCTVRTRIGELMPDNNDYWWKIDSTTDLESIALDVSSNIQAYGIPWLVRMSNLTEVRKAKSQPPFTSAAVSIILGDKDQAKQYLLQALRESPRAEESLKEWGRKYDLL